MDLQRRHLHRPPRPVATQRQLESARLQAHVPRHVACEVDADTGHRDRLLAQGLDIGMASTGNQLAVDLGGEKAGMAFNAAGGALGAAGAAGAFSSLPGFAAESGVVPLAAGA